MTTNALWISSGQGPGGDMILISAVLFVLAAFAGGGDKLAGITWYTWFAAGFAAWVLSGWIPLTLPAVNIKKRAE